MGRCVVWGRGDEHIRASVGFGVCFRSLNQGATYSFATVCFADVHVVEVDAAPTVCDFRQGQQDHVADKLGVVFGPVSLPPRGWSNGVACDTFDRSTACVVVKRCQLMDHYDEVLMLPGTLGRMAKICIFVSTIKARVQYCNRAFQLNRTEVLKQQQLP